MTDTERKRDAPVLIAVDDVSVTQWVKSYEAYVKRGGTRLPRDCIDADVLDTLGLLGIEVALSGEDERSPLSTTMMTGMQCAASTGKSWTSSSTASPPPPPPPPPPLLVTLVRPLSP